MDTIDKSKGLRYPLQLISLLNHCMKDIVQQTGVILDYEKSIIDFANSNPSGFSQVKDDIVVLYPKPTIWNSHCLTIFSENGKKLLSAFEDEEISRIAWEKYGFRTGVAGTNISTTDLGIGIPSKITSTVTSLKMSYYNKLIDYLSK